MRGQTFGSAGGRAGRRWRNDRRGAAAVEFAVVAPILVTIMMGLIQSGRGYEAKNLLEGAAREGARLPVWTGRR